MIRFRAHMRFTLASGMGQWCVDQMQQRMTMAFHLREDDSAFEASYAVVDSDGTFRCNAFWPDDRRDLADDTQAQFSALGPWCHPDTEDEASWMDTHDCEHQGELSPCPQPTWSWSL